MSIEITIHGNARMKKCEIIMHTAFAICEMLLIIAEIWSFANEDIITKWTGFSAGLSCCALAFLFAKHVRALCRKE